MEGLGTAYNMLETHSHEVEARLQELESTGRHRASAPHSFHLKFAYLCCCAFRHMHMLLAAKHALHLSEIVESLGGSQQRRLAITRDLLPVSG